MYPNLVHLDFEDRDKYDGVPPRPQCRKLSTPKNIHSKLKNINKINNIVYVKTKSSKEKTDSGSNTIG